MEPQKAIKSCYQCTKRRIKCDKTIPSCWKCNKKGLMCSGYGIRYRFKGDDPFVSLQPTTNRQKPDNAPPLASVTGQSRTLEPLSSFETSTEPGAALAVPSNSVRTQLESGRTRVETSTTSEDCHPAALTVHRGLDIVDSRTRLLFDHFSKRVSPVMVILDGEANGYRNYILRLAVTDTNVRKAVTVVATFHLLPHMPHLRTSAEAQRKEIIVKLRNSSKTDQPYFVFDDSTWIVILLLIMTDLISGHEDVLLLHRMLQNFLQYRGARCSQSPLVEFLQCQSKMIEFFAGPAQQESEGILQLKAVTNPVMDFEAGIESFLESYTPLHLYNEAFRQGKSIYLHRAQGLTDPINEEEMAKKVQQLMSLLFQIDPTWEGAHALVWPYFVAAAESVLIEQREFFLKKLEHIWGITGFRNVQIAINALPKIWKLQRQQRWTSVLPSIATIIL